MEEAPAEVNFNNNKTSKLSSKSFQRKKSKSKKKSDPDDEEEISLAQGLEEGQKAIDLFFDNKFEESKEISEKQ